MLRRYRYSYPFCPSIIKRPFDDIELAQHRQGGYEGIVIKAHGYAPAGLVGEGYWSKSTAESVLTFQ